MAWHGIQVFILRPSTAVGQQRRFWFDYLQEKRQVLRSDKEVERSDDKKEARADGGWTIPKGRKDQQPKGSKFSHSCPSPRDKELPPVKGAYRTKG